MYRISMSGIYQFVKAIIIIAVYINFASPFCTAQLPSCEGIDASSERKIVISRISYEQGISSERITDAMFFALNAKLSALSIMLSEGQPNIVTCSDRSPTIDGSSYNSDEIRKLHNSNVLLELWGDISAPQTGMAWLGFIVVPIKYYDTPSKSIGIHRIKFDVDTNSSVDDVIAQVSDGVEIDLFVSLALGIKALKNKEYDLARSFLCQASYSLKEAIDFNKLDRITVNEELLKNYIAEMVKKTTESARNDPEYAGPQKLLIKETTDDNPCPSL